MLPLLILLGGCLRIPPEIPPGNPEVPIIPFGACETDREATVACTVDGDTFDIGQCGQNTGGERFRMLGINAPEIAHEDPAECFGDRASAELGAVLAGGEVLLAFDATCLDRYGRTLAYVWLLGVGADGTPLIGDDDTADSADPLGGAMLVNEYMLANGYARLAPEDWNGGPLSLQDRLNAAEASARAHGIGLWSACE